MSLWFAFALMTAAAIFAVLWPLGRRSATWEIYNHFHNVKNLLYVFFLLR